MRVTFFRVAERKSPKKGRPYCLRPLRFATGQPGVLDHGVHRRTRCAPAALRSDNCGESVHEACVSFGTHATPRPARPRRIQKGTQKKRTSTRAIASLRCARPHLAGASATRCAVGAERSDGPCGCSAVGCLAPHPCWLRLRRGGCGVSMGVAAPMPRELTRRGCLNEAALQRSEFHGAPHSRPAAGLPLRTAKGSQTGGRLSFGYFSLAKQRKVPRPPGRLPASALNKGTPPNQRTQPNTTKSIATSAYPTSASSL